MYSHWEPGKLTWYVDGKQVYTTSAWHSGIDDDNRLAYPAPFDQNFYVILNLAIGGSWVQYPDEAAVVDMDNQSYDIDYVRVYQKDASVYEEMEKNVKRPEEVEPTYRNPDENGNFVVNGDFSKDLKPAGSDEDNFELHLEDDCKGKAVAVVEDGKVTISQDIAGGNTYSVQLKQDGIPLRKGWEYTLSFDASADLGEGDTRPIVVNCKGPKESYKTYFEGEAELTKETKTYSFDFTMDSKTDAFADIEFNLGNQPSVAPVTIDNVSIKVKTEKKDDGPNEKSMASDGNFVYNGTFDKGDDRLAHWEISKKDKANVTVTNVKNEDGTRRRELCVKVEVPEGTTPLNPIKVSQHELSPLLKGKYVFSFDAYKTDGAEDGMAAVLTNKKYSPKLTSEKQSFSYKAKMDSDITREESKVVFYFEKPGTYYLDNVVVREDLLILNGKFESGLAGYTYGSYEQSKASFGVDSLTPGNETALDVDIAKPGTDRWNIQVKQHNLQLEKDKYYKLTFKARSSIDRTVGASIQDNEDPYPYYNGGINIIELNDEWQDFELFFQMKRDVHKDACLSLELGGEGDDPHHVYFDEFMLVETDSEGNKIDTGDADVDEYETWVEPEDDKEDEDKKDDDKKDDGKKEDSKGKTNGDGKVQAGETAVTELGTFTAKSDKAAVYTPSEAAKKKESVVIPDAVKIDSNDVPVTIIDKNAFKGADLKSVTIGKNVTTISEGAFMNAKKLAKVTYKGKAVTTIGKNAFNGDKALKSMNLSKQKKLKTIGAGAFKNCKKIKTIKIYANKIKKIDKTAFKGCPNKKTTKVIIYAKNKTQYNKVVKMVKKAGLKKAKFKFKKAK